MNSLESQRGQTFAIWAFGTLSIVLLTIFSVAYGTMIQWQMRAQNAADAAAQGMLGVQTSQWNETISALHAGAIEEYRLRYIINDLLQVTRGVGGCDPTIASTANTSCDEMYVQLRQAYLDSVTRYTNDVSLLQRINAPTFNDDVTTIQNALAVYQKNCGSLTGGDCAFAYTLIGHQPRQDSLVENVYADCCAFTVGGGTSANPKQDLKPMEIEIVACANLNWPVSSFLNFQLPTYTVVGRAAATSIMLTQEFMYVGSIVNPKQGASVYQQSEFPESGYNGAIFSDNDPNYRIDYGGNPNNPYNGGNPAISNGKAGFTYVPGDEGILAATGWWGSMAIKPFMSTIQQGSTYTCK